MMTVRDLLHQPWTWMGPERAYDQDTGEYYELRIGELPDFFVAAATVEAARNEAIPALSAFLQSYVDAGEMPPLPGDPRVWRYELPSGPAKKRTGTKPVAPVAHQLELV